MPTMRMNKSLIMVTVAALTLCATAASVHAQEARGSGVGATSTLAGINGATYVYDSGSFHIVGLFGFVSVSRDPGDDSSGLALGGQFLFHLHDGASSDFSLGGGLTIVTDSEGDNDTTNFDLEGLAQIRAFIVPNVAVSASLGLLIAIGEDNNLLVGDDSIAGGVGNGDSAIAIGGQVYGAVGLTYFFK
jgi:AhpD family alkylhydroperoxidase